MFFCFGKYTETSFKTSACFFPKSLFAASSPKLVISISSKKLAISSKPAFSRACDNFLFKRLKFFLLSLKNSEVGETQ